MKVIGKRKTPTIQLLRLWIFVIVMHLIILTIPFILILPLFNAKTNQFILKEGVVDSVVFSYSRGGGKEVHRSHHYIFTLRGDSSVYSQKWMFGDDVVRENLVYKYIFTQMPIHLLSVINEGDTVQFYLSDKDICPSNKQDISDSIETYGMTVNGNIILPVGNYKFVKNYAFFVFFTVPVIFIMFIPIYLILFLLTGGHLWNTVRKKS